MICYCRLSTQWMLSSQSSLVFAKVFLIVCNTFLVCTTLSDCFPTHLSLFLKHDLSHFLPMVLSIFISLSTPRSFHVFSRFIKRFNTKLKKQFLVGNLCTQLTPSTKRLKCEEIEKWRHIFQKIIEINKHYNSMWI